MITRFTKLLVANRGEIAIRVLRAASELKLRTVAIYTYEDRFSLHRYKADEAYQVGADDDPLKPYLDIEAILKLAKERDVDAIHPGYGFLSENVHFARRCREEGIKFVGPFPEVMERLGDKVAAKTLARELEIPLIEDSQVDLTNADLALQEAQRIGYPVMLKAAAGGGGRGMRVVRSDDTLKTEYNEAHNEALKAFGDGTIFIEKYIDDPKHIEVQLLGDEHGSILHLYERDCSVQRRFQKVVEIAPSFGLKDETRQALYDYAVKIGKAVGYSCAGTVEFLIDKEENIYFIEVNPRIQVEHTITEEITGVDIVRSQILIAMGYPLSHPTIYLRSQEDVVANGCAIQCRVTTEDPINGFKPDYGTLIAYRSASGFGIRLDAGSAYAGATISPFFDSLLVKTTAWGRTMKGAADRLHRALREFRIRGVKTNIGFLMNLLQNETFREGNATVNLIADHPELLKSPKFRDRGTKTLRYLANVIVNGNPDVKYVDDRVEFRQPIVPKVDFNTPFPKGTKDLLNELGPQAFAERLKTNPKVQFTDTTFRDAHQSLLATRVRTIDLHRVAEAFAKRHGDQVFSMEVWGGATFDVAMRFLKESPWRRLRRLRNAMPNICLQMLLRGSNAVGYAAYPDNLIEKFIVTAAETGIDIFRIFDSLNWIESLKTSIHTVRNETNSLAEVCLCYTGDVSDPSKEKYTLQYYIDLARRLEDEGAHILAIKDMAGLLKPYAAEMLIGRLKEAVDLPIHLHTHDTSSIQASTYLKAIEAGVDVVDVAIASMSGLTSQPNFNALAAALQGQDNVQEVGLKSLNEFSNYWEAVRMYYYPFETELKAGTAEVYENEIPGGQYSNLRPQARGLGLEDQFETIKENYKAANQLLGDLVKVTPSSKVVGDLAMFMTSNGYNAADIRQKGASISFPDSVKALMRGDLGQTAGGFPADMQKLILKDEQPYTERPNAHLAPIDFEVEFTQFQEDFGPEVDQKDFLSYKLYPKVFRALQTHREVYANVDRIPTPAFFYGLKPNEEILVNIAPGKNILIQYLNMTEPDEAGMRQVQFRLNGQMRTVLTKDNSIQTEVVVHEKAKDNMPQQVGSPLQGNLSQILVKEGDTVEVNTPLFVIEAMKMESTITAPLAGVVKRVVLNERTLVEQDDLVVELS